MKDGEVGCRKAAQQGQMQFKLDLGDVSVSLKHLVWELFWFSRDDLKSCLKKGWEVTKLIYLWASLGNPFSVIFVRFSNRSKSYFMCGKATLQ